MYSLPVKRRIWPESRAWRSLSIAASQSSLVASATLIPSLWRTSGTVSVISVSISTLPLYFGSNRSETEWISGALAVSTQMPVWPPCQGIEYLRPGSSLEFSNWGRMFWNTVGRSAWLICCR